ncbi:MULTISPECIES: Rep family protein [unclassified Nesterenkonia]|uniref:Rep family protein n=1 Tax=unclassified Nesterenkonia TaxID=2629769 RepID=UPI001F4C7094|nr:MULTISPECIES: Rep family protein [unclassified Nesterenkonia]MCH8560285.1 replication protein [Nesterenkonia sp. DZ6]MCH8563710.1 replication protein [Nesterenkonia sp. YGD6]
MMKFTTRLIHPNTGAVLLNLDEFEHGLDQHKSIKEYAWVLQDKDRHPDGTPVATHVQGALRLQDGRTLHQVSSWIGIAEHLVIPLKGRGAFPTYLRYLTHEAPSEQAKRKHRYEDSEVHANFDWRAVIDAHFARTREQPTDTLTQVKLDLLNGRTSLAQVRERYPLIFVDHHPRLGKIEANWRENAQFLALGFNYVDAAGNPDIHRIAALKGLADQLGFTGSLEEQCKRAVQHQTSAAASAGV